ncbi:MAG TPA: hypothetical protein ENG23_04010 [Methanomicrobia archaeon]|nr:hypothetical protein [Methanomicrobia archaeon]
MAKAGNLGAGKKAVELSDVNRELQKVVSSGKVRLGSRKTLKALRERAKVGAGAGARAGAGAGARAGAEAGAKIVIYASNCPAEIKEAFTGTGTSTGAEQSKNGGGETIFYEYPANSHELGLACKKPFSVASLCILETGGSEISRLLSTSSEENFKKGRSRVSK